MAGSATTDLSKKLEIAHKVIGDQYAQTDQEQVGVENLWCQARMLSSDELATATQNLVQESSSLSMNYPFGLIHSHHWRKCIKRSTTYKGWLTQD
nr:deubiquitinase [Salmonella sp. NCTC 7297]